MEGDKLKKRRNSLECSDLSPLCSVVACRDRVEIDFTRVRRRAAADQSGDLSPQSKKSRTLSLRAGVNCPALIMQKLPRHRFRIVLIAVTGASLFSLAAFRFQRREHAHAIGTTPTSASRISQLPATILWAWERPEKLDFIDPQKIGVAFLAKTIYLRGDRVVSRPRLQSLAVPAGAAVIAVARIESEHPSLSSKPPTLSGEQIAEAASEISELGSLPNVAMVQVDFDARTSERDFYRELLIQLRSKLPQSTPLSITALASWCKGDNWLEDLPVDEAVPMLFRMGVERKQFLSQLAAGEGFTSKPCQASAGVSTDEPLRELPRVQRLYVFNPGAWSPDALNQTMETYKR